MHSLFPKIAHKPTLHSHPIFCGVFSDAARLWGQLSGKQKQKRFLKTCPATHIAYNPL
jgi:hypothetical protein